MARNSKVETVSAVVSIADEKAIDQQAEQHLQESPAGIGAVVPEGAAPTVPTETVDQAKADQAIADQVQWSEASDMEPKERASALADLIEQDRDLTHQKRGLGTRMLVLLATCQSRTEAEEVIELAVNSLTAFNGNVKTHKAVTAADDGTFYMYRSQILIAYSNGVLPSDKPILKISQIMALNKVAKAKKDNADKHRVHAAVDVAVQKEAQVAAKEKGIAVPEMVSSDDLTARAMKKATEFMSLFTKLAPSIQMSFWERVDVQKAIEETVALSARARNAVNGVEDKKAA